MPLFKSKDKRSANSDVPSGDPSYRSSSASAAGLAGNHVPVPGSQMGPADDRYPTYGGAASGGGAPGQGQMPDPNYNYSQGNNNLGRGQDNDLSQPQQGRRGAAGAGSASQPGPGMDNSYNNQGGGMAGGGQAIPPAASVGAQSGRGGSSFSGKVERTVGTMIGSSSLKALKGHQKELEANALKVQSAELAEAERLEREAMMRRERAVAHGAHPDNKHLGSSLMPGSNSGNGYH